MVEPLPVPRAPALPAPLVAREQRDLLCALAYVCLGVGESRQAVTLLALVAREAPDDPGMLRLLAYAQVAEGNGAAALAALDRLAAIEPEEGPLLLLRSHALRLSGRIEEGRACFRLFVSARHDQDSR